MTDTVDEFLTGDYVHPDVDFIWSDIKLCTVFKLENNIISNREQKRKIMKVAAYISPEPPHKGCEVTIYYVYKDNETYYVFILGNFLLMKFEVRDGIGIVNPPCYVTTVLDDFKQFLKDKKICQELQIL